MYFFLSDAFGGYGKLFKMLITQSALKELLLVTTMANRPRQHINKRFLLSTSGSLNKGTY